MVTKQDKDKFIVTPSELHRLHDSTSKSIDEEIYTHLKLVCLIVLLFVVAVGAAYAEYWARTQSLVTIPEFVFGLLKLIEGGLFLSGCLSTLLFIFKTFLLMLSKIVQDMFNMWDQMRTFFDSRK